MCFQNSSFPLPRFYPMQYTLETGGQDTFLISTAAGPTPWQLLVSGHQNNPSTPSAYAGIVPMPDWVADLRFSIID